jgi:ubiquinone/menaquinone biosynthesis C-methylase UbiE
MGKPIGAGKSSFDLIDSTLFFDELDLKKGTVLLDLGCGEGLYTLAASEAIGKGGQIYAIDLWEEGITHLKEQTSAKGITNIIARVADVSKKIPLSDYSTDLCLMATVLHDLLQVGAAEGTLREIRRVLNLQGTLAIVEFKKIEGPPGPPIRVRLNPEDVERIVSPFGFRKRRTADIGPFNYLMTFSLPAHLHA